MATLTLYPSGPPTGVDLGAAGAIVTNYGAGTVSYSDTAEPFVAEGTIATNSTATLYGTQFFRATAGATIGTVALVASSGGTAAAITFTPAGTIAATNTQAAVEEVATEAASALTTHTADTANPHIVTKTQVGLGNVTNTSDANKPVSTAQQTALDLKAATIETVNTVAGAGSTETIPDVTTATIHRVTLDTANCVLTFPTAAAGKSFTLVLVQDATGSRTVTWPSVLWPANTAPTLTTTAGKRDVLTFMCADGSNWLGFVAGQNL